MAPAAEPAVESKRLVKLSVFFKKRADLTDEEFQRYWSDNHGPLFTSLACAQEKLVKYNQVGLTPSIENCLQDSLVDISIFGSFYCCWIV